MNHIIDLSVLNETCFNNCIIYDIRYNKILLGYVSATLHLKNNLQILASFSQIHVFIKFPFDLYWFPKAVRIISFVSFFLLIFSTYSPLPSLLASFSYHTDRIFQCYFVKFNFHFLKDFFLLIQLEPLDIYPFHQNLSIICYRLALPFPFPLPLNC